MAGFGDEQLILRGPTGVTNQGTSGGSSTYFGGMGTIANTGFNGISAFNFDGSNDYINIGTVSASTTFSVGFWVNFKINPSSQIVNYIVGMETNAGVFFGGSAAATVDNKIGTYDGSGVDTVKSATAADQLNWRLIVVNFTATSVTIYRDGVADGTGSMGTAISPTTVNIGRRPDNFWYSSAFVDDVRISTTLRTAGQIADWYTAGRGYDAPISQRRRMTQLSMQRSPF